MATIKIYQSLAPSKRNLYRTIYFSNATLLMQGMKFLILCYRYSIYIRILDTWPSDDIE